LPLPRVVDFKPSDEWYQRFPQVENHRLDLQARNPANARRRAWKSSTISPPGWKKNYAWIYDEMTKRK
jgi:hypothetical protein